MSEQTAKISIPTVPRNFHNDHFTNTQTPRISQIFPGFQFHSEFVGSGTSSSSLWPVLEQTNYQQVLPSSDVMQQTMDVFGSQTQWLNHNSNNLSLPMLHGVMKQEEEENKDLSHSVISSLYLSSSQNPQGGSSNHMSAATTSLLETESQMGSTRTVITNDDDNNNNNSNTLFNNVNNFSIVEKFYKQGHHENEDLNELVNLEGGSRTSFGGEYLLNDSFGTVNVNGTKNLDHVAMLVDRETRITNRYLRDSSLMSKDKNQMGFTRDFLGVGDDDESMSRSTFLQQELDGFHGMGSLGNNLQSQFRGGGDYC